MHVHENWSFQKQLLASQVPLENKLLQTSSPAPMHSPVQSLEKQTPQLAAKSIRDNIFPPVFFCFRCSSYERTNLDNVCYNNTIVKTKIQGVLVDFAGATVLLSFRFSFTASPVFSPCITPGAKTSSQFQARSTLEARERWQFLFVANSSDLSITATKLARLRFRSTFVPEGQRPCSFPSEMKMGWSLAPTAVSQPLHPF